MGDAFFGGAVTVRDTIVGVSIWWDGCEVYDLKGIEN
jgi:hypothetical protein